MHPPSKRRRAAVAMPQYPGQINEIITMNKQFIPYSAYGFEVQDSNTPIAELRVECNRVTVSIHTYLPLTVL